MGVLIGIDGRLSPYHPKSLLQILLGIVFLAFATEQNIIAISGLVPPDHRDFR